MSELERARKRYLEQENARKSEQERIEAEKAEVVRRRRDLFDRWSKLVAPEIQKQEQQFLEEFSKTSLMKLLEEYVHAIEKKEGVTLRKEFRVRERILRSYEEQIEAYESGSLGNLSFDGSLRYHHDQYKNSRREDIDLFTLFGSNRDPIIFLHGQRGTSMIYDGNLERLADTLAQVVEKRRYVSWSIPSEKELDDHGAGHF